MADKPQNLKKDSEKQDTASDAKSMWQEQKRPWSATSEGRLAIRTFSRGIMGAAFYSWAGNKAVADLKNYDAANPQNALQHMAKFFDVAIGKPIEKVFGEQAVQFRPTLETGTRSFGPEMVINTFNFAMASTGDALGRNILGLFDPAAEKKWRNKDGKLSFPGAVKTVTGIATNSLGAQMEDWFVSIPYTFQKKFQHRLIDKFSPGFQYDADRALNGSSFKLDEEGNITGSYSLESAIDFQGRFTAYNFGTLMFRDLKEGIKGARKDSDGSKKSIRPKSILMAPITGTRYMMKSALKTTIYMTPAIPVFWSTRPSQLKNRGIALLPDGTPIMGQNGKPLTADSGAGQAFRADGSQSPVNPFGAPDFDPYQLGHTKFDTWTTAFGKASYKATVAAEGAASKIAQRTGRDEAKMVDLANRYAHGAFAYTPYIYAKNEFAHKWDNKSMDDALYRAIDGVFRLRPKEIKGGVKDVFSAMKHGAKKDNAPPMAEKKYADHVSAPKAPEPSSGGNWKDRIGNLRVDPSPNR